MGRKAAVLALLLFPRGWRRCCVAGRSCRGDEGDEDGWARASALFETLGKAELLATPAEQLLHRLFHEEKPALMGEKPLSFACSCSRERVAAMLQSLGEEEARAAAADTGAVEVRCEFCGREYHFH